MMSTKAMTHGHDHFKIQIKRRNHEVNRGQYKNTETEEIKPIKKKPKRKMALHDNPNKVHVAEKWKWE